MVKIVSRCLILFVVELILFHFAELKDKSNIIGDKWMLSPKEIAQHDGIGVLGSEYLSTSCVKGRLIKSRYIHVYQFL